MIGSHFTLVQVAERLHRHFLDVLRQVLSRAGITDLTPVEALLLTNLAEDDVGLGELAGHGYYAASVVESATSLIARGYLTEETNLHGHLRLRLTERGKDFFRVVRALQEHLSQDLERRGLEPETVFSAIDVLETVEETWNSYLAN